MENLLRQIEESLTNATLEEFIAFKTQLEAVLKNATAAKRKELTKVLKAFGKE